MLNPTLIRHTLSLQPHPAAATKRTRPRPRPRPHPARPRQLIERVLGALCRERNRGSPDDSPALGVVRIHGALHGDERAAFQEIARQLCATFRCSFSRTASYDDNLAFLKEMLQQLRR